MEACHAGLCAEQVWYLCPDMTFLANGTMLCMTIIQTTGRQEYPFMRIRTAMFYLILMLTPLGCDRQQSTGEIDPQLGIACFEQQRPSLPPGTQYEGIEQLSGDRLTIRIMNGVEVVTLDCMLNEEGVVQGAGR